MGSNLFGHITYTYTCVLTFTRILRLNTLYAKLYVIYIPSNLVRGHTKIYKYIYAIILTYMLCRPIDIMAFCPHRFVPRISLDDTKNSYKWYNNLWDSVSDCVIKRLRVLLD